MTSAEGIHRTPRYQEPQLTRKSEIAAKQQVVSNTPQAAQRPTHTGRQEYSHCVSVFRKDRKDMTRTDQFRVQTDIAEDILAAADAGNLELLSHAGTRLMKRNILVFCSEQSANFYKKVISKLKDREGNQYYDCFLPGEKLPGHRIYTNTLPSCMKERVHQIVKLFCIGNGINNSTNEMNINYGQVKIYGTPVLTRTGLAITLEIDDAAFQYLSTQQWMSWIGLFNVRWQAPPIPGLSGYVPPDQDPREVRKVLFDTQIALTTEEFPPLGAGTSSQEQRPSSSTSAPHTSPGKLTVTPTAPTDTNTVTEETTQNTVTELVVKTINELQIIEDTDKISKDEENKLLGNDRPDWYSDEEKDNLSDMEIDKEEPEAS